MIIDDDIVRHVAILARLDLTDEEVAKYRGQLDRVIDHIDRLKEVDVEGVEPPAHAGDLRNVFREDAPRPSLSNEAALGNAPEKNEGFFVVPRIIEGPGDRQGNG